MAIAVPQVAIHIARVRRPLHNSRMNLKPVLVALGLVVVVGAAWKSYGLQGVLFAGGAVMMWVMINVNRTMGVMRRAANRPVGYVSSAVMLNARIKPKATLMHVTAMTGSLGELTSPKGVQPEIYRWTDASDSSVVGVFLNGKLQSWELIRPAVEADEPSDAAAGQPAPATASAIAPTTEPLTAPAPAAASSDPAKT